MNETAVKLLEYDKIKERLAEYAVSEQAKTRIVSLEPSIDIDVIRRWIAETTEARAIVDKSTGIPLNSLTGVEKTLAKLGKSTILHPEELSVIAKLLEDCRRVKRFMKSMENLAPTVSSYALSINELEIIVDQINQCIVNEQVDDRASSELHRIRKKIMAAEEKIKSKLESMLKTHGSSIQDAFVSMRAGRYVIPVKKEYRKNIEGSIVDTSGSGSTLFIEPEAVRRLQDELNLLKIEEDKEVYRILCELTNMVESHQREISINIEIMINYDFLLAKGKFSRAIGGNPVELNNESYIYIRNGKHPLIGSSAVPLNFTIGEKYRALVITGPNTGGKTVVLKTVGLLTMMAQSGLHVSVDEGSELAIFRNIAVDIGDGQSIEQSLSTFSSHIKNISGIISCADPYTLVIVDELGAGTDPGEGMGLAIAVLEEVYARGATLLATTHYSEIKDFAYSREGFENGRMEFDTNTLKPLYRLRIGEAGESNAFLIALRLGIDKKLIERAHEITYKEKKEYSEPVQSLDMTADIKTTDAESQASSFDNEQIERLKKIQAERQKLDRQKNESSFKLGDCVYISTMDRTGIVCELENTKGELGVMVMKKKIRVSKKRLSLYIDGEKLYPEEYDFDIVFDSKENRKKKKIMSKRYEEGLTIEISEGREQ